MNVVQKHKNIKQPHSACLKGLAILTRFCKSAGLPNPPGCALQTHLWAGPSGRMLKNKTHLHTFL